MNILFANATRRWGGVKTWTLDLAEWLAASGHAPAIACRPGPFAEAALARGLAALPLEFGFDFNPLILARFLNLFKQLRTELVVVNVGKDMCTAGAAARLAGLPIVQRVGLPGDMAAGPKRRLLHAALKPRLLAPSEFVRRGMLEALPWLSPVEVTAIHTGKRPAPVPPATAGRPRRLVVSSQLNPDKGHAELFAALSSLAAAGHDFRLEVIGTGSIEAGLKALSAELGLGPKVDFTGFVSDVPARLAAADIFVLPSRSEGLPNTLLEAMAAGLAPVARMVGGVNEIWPDALAPLSAGLPGDDAALAGALATALSADDARLVAWKEAAWQACRARFDLETQAARTLRFFEETRRGFQGAA